MCSLYTTTCAANNAWHLINYIGSVSLYWENAAYCGQVKYSILHCMYTVTAIVLVHLRSEGRATLALVSRPFLKCF